jgi:hypothetical protein
MVDEVMISSDSINYETDMVDHVEDSAEALLPVNQMVNYVTKQFQRAESKKMADEDRFLQSYRNFRGLYGPDVQFTDSERSRVFVKVTKTKVLAAYGQIIEVLFGNNTFPLTVDHTKLPEGVVEDVHFDPMDPTGGQSEKPMGGQAAAPVPTRDGPQLAPGATSFDMKLGPLTEKLSGVKDKLIEGPGTTATAVTFHPAYVAAKKMEKKILDQLEEAGTNKQLRAAAFEMALFGTGILKGPFTTEKEYPNWNGQGLYQPTMKDVPSTSHVSIWNFYPDPDAANMDEAEWCIERHKMSETQLYELKDRPYFREQAIDRACDTGPNYFRKGWENVMEDGVGHVDVERFEVLEFWGFVPAETLKDHGVKIPRIMRKLKQINVNVWVCNNEILRLVLNPFKPARIPYYAVPYELNPYSFFGIGVAENMEDSQLLMNGFMRMAVDNAVLSGNLIIEVDETNLVPGQDLTFYPGKVIRRQGGAPGQALFGTEFPNVAQQNMMLYEQARKLSDESTGFPSYAHGQTGIQGVGRTASGISMLMNAANGNIRTVVKNLDDYLLGPMGRAFFSWNMQFAFDPGVVGDLEVNARGTESLMANEVRSQRLMQFLQLVSNPILAPFAKLDVIVREIAKSMDLDPDKVANSLPDAAVQAEVIKAFTAQQEQMGGGGGASSAPPGGLSTESGPGSGGGTIGTGSAAQPGESGFSANKGTS